MIKQKTPEILYEDRDLLVCRKNAGLAVESAGAGQMDLVSLLRNYRMQKEKKSYIAPVHRLDQPVEGVMVFAKNKKAAASLSSQVQSGSWEKDYLALVCGRPPALRGHLEDYLARDGRKNISRVVSKGTKGAKKAELEYETVTAEAGLTLLQIHLLTGRHHQIRVQLSAAGMPVYADAKYGTAVPGTFLALCAWHLHFVHPRTAEEMDFRISPSFFPLKSIESVSRICYDKH